VIRILLLILPALCFAKDVKLKSDLPLQKNITEAHGRVVEFEQEDLVLVGHARQLDLSKTEKLVQIVWTEIRNVNNQNERVVLEEPLAANFKYAKPILKAKTNIVLDYDPEIIKTAMAKLKKGEIDAEDIVMKGEAKNSKSNKRSLLDLGTSPAEYKNIILANNKANKQQRDLVNTLGGNNYIGHIGNNVSGAKQMASDTGSSANGVLEQQLNNIKNDGNSQRASSNNPSNGTEAQNAGRNNHLGNSNGQYADNNNLDNQDYEYNLDNNNNNQALDLEVNNLDLVNGAIDNDLNVDEANLHPENEAENESDLEAVPEVSIRITTNGCHPRVDEDLNRVFVQDRTIKYVNGIEVAPDNPQDGLCSDSNQQYAIHKRYDCPNCNYVEDCKTDGNQSYACATFEKYWTDESGQEHLVTTGDLNGGALYTDLEHPFVLTKEVGKCEYDVNLSTMQAIPQTELVYYDRTNKRVIVGECEPSIELPPIPISLSTTCPLIHDYQNNVSKIQKKAIFTVNGVEHVARGCVETDETIPHEFVTDGCNANIDPIIARYARMGKRKITLPDGKTKLLSQECEVIGQADNLLSTREGCIGEYVHDFNAGLSYEKHHFYYMEGNRRVYLPACMRSPVSYQHDKVHEGYEFDEANERAIKKIATFINPPEGRLNIAPAMTDESYGIFLYQKLGNTETRLTNNFVYDGCFKVTQTEIAQKLRRPDGTMIDKILGKGAPQRSHNLCQVTTESRRVLQGYTTTYRCGRRNEDDQGEIVRDPIYGTQLRTKTVYPNGRVEYSPWR
jgi:hypothetical protein